MIERLPAWGTLQSSVLSFTAFGTPPLAMHRGMYASYWGSKMITCMQCTSLHCSHGPSNHLAKRGNLRHNPAQHRTSRLTSSPSFSSPMKALARASVAPTVTRVSVCQSTSIAVLAAECRATACICARNSYLPSIVYRCHGRLGYR